MGKGFEQTISQGRYTYGQWVYKKLPNITNHQRKTSEKHIELSPDPVSMAIIKKSEDKCQRGCGEKAIIENSIQVPPKVKNESTI